ncbi:f-box domain-containing protein [Gigaspora margarita]|uniref:F-box domain-containing protein n=1 Tax=Gigaspora margarita TaxID=4874 RepID=A0A8H4AMH8_GIGMA|nr:f-box domain-containing protein [Gigaspora margarita]
MVFPDEILLETFKHIQTDYRSLFSCLLVNRQWCKIIVPILWSEPIKHVDDKRLIKIYLSELNAKEQASLIPFNIFLPNYPKPLFDYASYTTTVGFHLTDGILSWLNNEGLGEIIYDIIETEVEFAIKCSLISMFLRKNEKLKHLEIKGNINMMILEGLRINNTVTYLDLLFD